MWQGTAVEVGQVAAGCVVEWLGEERHGSFGEACWGVFRQGKARCGSAAEVWFARVRWGTARSGSAVMVWQVEARIGMARLGLAGQGKSSQGIKE